jgi:hypothetical protein
MSTNDDHLTDAVFQAYEAIGSITPKAPPAKSHLLALVADTVDRQRKRLWRDLRLFTLLVFALCGCWLLGYTHAVLTIFLFSTFLLSLFIVPFVVLWTKEEGV